MYFKSEISFNWLLSRDIRDVKELSRALLACHLWDVKSDLAPKLIRLKKEGSWNHSLRDTSRAASALAAIGLFFPDVSRRMLSEQKGGSWNEDVYDTAYALLALADMGVEDREGCMWLVENYGPAWEHPGTTALILSALTGQLRLGDKSIPGNEVFIHERARWLLSRRTQEGAWGPIATSNLVMQALLLAGYGRELEGTSQWLLSRMNINGAWGENAGDVTATSLSLITLGYLKYRGLLG
jgi:squalene cyclase